MDPVPAAVGILVVAVGRAGLGRHQPPRPLVLDVLAMPELIERVDRGDLVEVVDRRRRGRHPFEGPRVPGVGDVGGVRPRLRVGDHDVHEEHEDRQGDQERADRRDLVPERETERLGIRVGAADHALEAEDVHRAEREVEPDRSSARSGSSRGPRSASARTPWATSSTSRRTARTRRRRRSRSGSARRCSTCPSAGSPTARSRASRRRARRSRTSSRCRSRTASPR